MASVAPTPYTYSPIPVPSGGEWKSPDFSLEARRSKVASTPILPISPSTLQQKHPDEEKGRSFRSSSSSQLLFAVTSDSNQQEEQGDGTIPFDELDDDGAFADLALADRAGLYETAFGLLPAFKHAPPVASTSFDWTTTLANAFDRIDGKLDVSQRGLSYIPSEIKELAALRSLPEKASLSAVPARTRTLARTQSVPNPISPPSSSSRSFARSASGSLPPSPSSTAPKTAVALEFNFSNNDLCADSFPNAFFTLSNLRVLFLRQNHLERLPEGIGRLADLVELSVSNNQLTYIPAEILRLSNLSQLRLHPNPFLSPPSTSSSPSSKRLLGPLKVNFTVPSLFESMTRKLLAPASSKASLLPSSTDSTPPLTIQGYELPFDLSDTVFAPFKSIMPLPPSSNLSHAASRARERTTSVGSTRSLFNPSPPVLAAPGPQPFDPSSNVCYSPAHAGEGRHFYQPAVERFEWVSESSLKSGRVDSGPKKIPLRHRGCGATCLDWLEEEEEEMSSEGEVTEEE